MQTLKKTHTQRHKDEKESVTKRLVVLFVVFFSGDNVQFLPATGGFNQRRRRCLSNNLFFRNSFLFRYFVGNLQFSMRCIWQGFIVQSSSFIIFLLIRYSL